MSPSGLESPLNFSRLYLSRMAGEEELLRSPAHCAPLSATGTERSQQQQRQVCGDLSCRSRHVLSLGGNLPAPKTTRGTETVI